MQCPKHLMTSLECCAKSPTRIKLLAWHDRCQAVLPGGGHPIKKPVFAGSLQGTTCDRSQHGLGGDTPQAAAAQGPPAVQLVSPAHKQTVRTRDPQQGNADHRLIVRLQEWGQDTHRAQLPLCCGITESSSKTSLCTSSRISAMCLPGATQGR